MKCEYVIGIDEVGRGALAGPLCVGACLVPRGMAKMFNKTISGIKDSKQLTPQKRAGWFRTVANAAKNGACKWGTVFVSEKVIDARGLSVALSKAIEKVLKKLRADPSISEVLLDGGIRAPNIFSFQQTIIRGDEKVPLIAAASVMAKCARDRYMIRLGRRYPAYAFERHKGYGTEEHYRALRKHGISEAHRKSFLSKFEARSTKSETISKS